MRGKETRTENVAYSVGRIPEFIDVARSLRTRLGWRPAYWVTLPRNHDLVSNAFPDAAAHPFLDLNRGIAPPSLAPLFEGALSASDLNRAAPYLPIAMALLDRIDIGKQFTFQERSSLIHRLIIFFQNVVEHFSLQRVIFHVPPHSVGEYLLYAVFKMIGRPIRMFRPTPICNLHIICEAPDELPDSLRRAYAARLKGQKYSVPPDVAESIAKVRNASSNYQPSYVEDTNALEAQHKATVIKIEQALDGGFLEPETFIPGRIMKVPNEKGELVPIGIRKEGSKKPMGHALKLPGRPLASAPATKSEFLAYRDWAMIQKIKLRRHYLRLCRPYTDVDKPYVYFAMHYQPERTTCPDGGLFGDQLLAIRLIAAELPDGWQILVKEHPSQFNYTGMGELGRWDTYYDEIAALPNVSFVQLDTPSLDLVDNASAVATITGMVGWEALVRGKPVLCFGSAWYQFCRGAFRLESRDDARRAFVQIKKGLRPTTSDVLAYAGALRDIGQVVYTIPSFAKGMTDLTDLADKIATMLVDYEGAPSPTCSNSN